MVAQDEEGGKTGCNTAAVTLGRHQLNVASRLIPSSFSATINEADILKYEKLARSEMFLKRRDQLQNRP